MNCWAELFYQGMQKQETGWARSWTTNLYLTYESDGPVSKAQTRSKNSLNQAYVGWFGSDIDGLILNVKFMLSGADVSKATGCAC